MSKDAAIVDYCRAYLASHGYPPTRREIASACGLSSLSVVTYRLGKLREAGVLEFDAGVARAIRILDGVA
ncbi:MAG: hypothetical protein K1X87_12205 [Dehalococcoidia bacterium]|nr:hypothetical protein [Dehalococcoidia bacterium]